MNEWMTETELSDLDKRSREPAAETEPASGRRDVRARPEDRRWLAYVAKLAPDDRDAAFLLPDELPNAQPQPQHIRSAIEAALRRAFDSPQFRIEGYEAGKIQGEMRVLLPQGIEQRYHFDDELGWKATVVVSAGGQERSFPVYWRKACMNPLRRAIIEGELDTSGVSFAPLDGEEIEQIAANPEIDRMTAQAIRRLYSQYKTLSGR